jgi:hypothetical protein
MKEERSRVLCDDRGGLRGNADDGVSDDAGLGVAVKHGGFAEPPDAFEAQARQDCDFKIVLPRIRVQGNVLGAEGKPKEHVGEI